MMMRPGIPTFAKHAIAVHDFSGKGSSSEMCRYTGHQKKLDDGKAKATRQIRSFRSIRDAFATAGKTTQRPGGHWKRQTNNQNMPRHQDSSGTPQPGSRVLQSSLVSPAIVILYDYYSDTCNDRDTLKICQLPLLATHPPSPLIRKSRSLMLNYPC